MNILFIPLVEQRQTFARTQLFLDTLSGKHAVFGIPSTNSIPSKIQTYLKAKEIMKSKGIDLVFCEQPENAFIGAQTAKAFGKPLFFDSHGSVALFAESLKKGIFYRKLFLFFEKSSASAARTITTVSEIDRREILKHGIGAEKAFVLPTWIETARIRQTRIEKAQSALGFDVGKKHLLFFGTLDYRPNQAAVKFIAETLSPALKEKSCVLHVCGSGKPECKLPPNAQFHGFVPQITDYISASDAVIAPLWQGVGILEKVLLAMACGKPVITTTFAVRGIPELADMENSLVAESAGDFAAKTIMLLDGKTDYAKICKNARALVEKRYSESNAKTLLRLVEGAIK